MKIAVHHIDSIISRDLFTHQELVYLLSLQNTDELDHLRRMASAMKKQYVGNITWLRGLIEFSNRCTKNCLYCGIRSGNNTIERFTLSEDEILEAASFAHENHYGSVVLQSGEQQSRKFTDFVCRVTSEIRSRYNLSITLSCGEQSEDTYRRFFESGAHRYLLRIETSSRELYNKIHPADRHHDFETRLNCLKMLRKIGFQVGTGIMVGLPFQTYNDLARDISFFREMDIDMAGLGPYIEHADTPLYSCREMLMPAEERLKLTLKVIAILRIVMKDINIASATALQAIGKMGREKGLQMGANIIMPNLTPEKNRKLYQLYKDKPCLDENAAQCKDCLEKRIAIAGDTVGYGGAGDSNHYKKRT